MAAEKIQITKAYMKKKKKDRGIDFDFKLYYKAMVIKTAWWWHKKKKIERPMKQNRAPRNKPLHLWSANI